MVCDIPILIARLGIAPDITGSSMAPNFGDRYFPQWTRGFLGLVCSVLSLLSYTKTSAQRAMAMFRLPRVPSLRPGAPGVSA
ncbi:hypothetical protein RRG08_000712 [Elysia crispata]|uniref:Uncharacterized protein n=1 Tax=Elysia crispata TaxID=231223 RepID=A0AAE1AY33_9GAST|nr:hypothetical protein RRG08_000712 [Elysia crispata]